MKSNAQLWSENKLVNPATGRAIQYRGPTYLNWERRWNYEQSPIVFVKKKKKSVRFAKKDEILQFSSEDPPHYCAAPRKYVRKKVL